MPFNLWLIGFLSLPAQVVILRELAVAYYGIELIYLLALGIWLVGSGLGALSNQWGRGDHHSISQLLVWFALLLLLEMGLIRGLPVIFGAIPGAFLPFARQILGLCLTVLPISGLVGLLFARTATDFLRKGHSLAEAYSLECAGAAAGGIASAAGLHFGVSNLASGLALVAVALLPALISSARSHPVRFAVAAGLTLAVATALLFAGSLDLITTRWSVAQAVRVTDTPYHRVVIAEHTGQISIYENGALSYESEGTGAEEIVHPAALQQERIDSVLVLGGSTDGTVAELLQHSPQCVDVVELDRRRLDAVYPYLPLRIRSTFTDRRVCLFITDPRRFLRDSPEYDLIVLAASDPSSAQGNRFFTQEFFQLVRQSLSPEGVFAIRLRSAENYWSDPLTWRNAAVVSALRSAFDDVLVLPGTSNVLLAGSTLNHNPEILAERFVQRSITARSVSPEYLRYLYTNDRAGEIRQMLESLRVPPNSDDRPACFWHSVMMWLAKFNPRLIALPPTSLSSPKIVPTIGLLSLLVMLPALLLARRRTHARMTALVAFSAFAGILVESALLLHYQITCGILYRDLGLLLTLFMLGMSLGAITIDRLTRRSLPARWPHRMVHVIAFVGGMAAWGIHSFGSLTLPAAGFGLIAVGFAVAAIFAYAGLCTRSDPRWSSSVLYAADIFGGALGTIIGSLLLVPLFGLTASLLVAAFTALLALIVA